MCIGLKQTYVYHDCSMRSAQRLVVKEEKEKGRLARLYRAGACMCCFSMCSRFRQESWNGFTL